MITTIISNSNNSNTGPFCNNSNDLSLGAHRQSRDRENLSKLQLCSGRF